MDEKLIKAQELMGVENQIPEPQVKYEKKEKGLYERVTRKPVLITEDNKVMLND